MKYLFPNPEQRLIKSHIRSILIAPSGALDVSCVSIGRTRKKCHTLLKQIKERIGEPYAVPVRKDNISSQVLQPPQEPLKPSLCAICGQPIVNRGGAYCGRCAGLNGVLHSWDKVKAIRQRETVIVKEQRNIFDFCPGDAR